ncbi:hypothetical protein DSO57_1030532 [Entomophthora muscae]|uniref:Uncharacterized protein n=1 Tax=Entomophthora muscae TaxID=34485 RepID=A0ACC2RS09_9FUNG|nr:hypothetical protein DSO57_1030532 [Entomophthora muscae]
MEDATDQATALKQIHQELQVTISAAVTTYKKYADCKRQEGSTYRPGDLVMVDAHNMKLKVLCRKLGPKQAEPFKVEYQIASQCIEYLVSWKGYPNSKNSWAPHYNFSNSQVLIQEFYNCHPTAIGHPKLTLATMKLPLTHKNFSLSHLPDGGIVPQAKAKGNVTVNSTMPGIILPSKKAQKASSPLKN